MNRVADRKPVHRGEAVILFQVGENMFAISATAVEEIRNTDGLRKIGVAGHESIPKVKYILTREGREYHVVDAAQYFRMLPAHCTRVLVLRNSRAAVLVSHIDRMAEIGNVVALPQAFQGEERNWYRGLTVFDAAGEMPSVVPVVRPETFLTPTELQALEAEK